MLCNVHAQKPQTQVAYTLLNKSQKANNNKKKINFLLYITNIDTYTQFTLNSKSKIVQWILLILLSNSNLTKFFFQENYVTSFHFNIIIINIQ